MNAKHVELSRRLEQFQLDSPEASLPFSGRLAKENHWLANHTRRVIAEYKRFAFLAVAAGHPVSPSEDVDQTWHLHLTYTQNYWKVFCGEVLQTPLHHQPTQGGEAERAKFHDWYAATLASYEKFFGEPPPADIWPPPAAGEKAGHQFTRVDRSRNWVIPKPSLRLARRFATLGAFGLLMTLCCGAMLTQGADPFDWRGPDFLVFYLVLAGFCFITAAWLRRSLRLPSDREPGVSAGLDPYAMAYLNGGRVLAVNTAIATLVNQKAMRVDAKGKRSTSLVYLPARLTSLVSRPANLHPLEQIVYSAADSTDGETFVNVRAAAKSYLESIADDLKRRGWVVANTQAAKAVGLPLLIAGIVPLAGLVKIAIGLSRDRPVSILVFLTIAATVAAVLGFARRPLRSRRGDIVFEELKTRHAGMNRLKGNPAGLSPAEFATVVGLFGLVALEGTALADLRMSLRPPGVASSCGSSISSCGGSGGCGGGGCGGGGSGCGGCGGGH